MLLQCFQAPGRLSACSAIVLTSTLPLQQVPVVQHPARKRLKQSWKPLQAIGSASIALLPTEILAAQHVKSAAMLNRLQHSQHVASSLLLTRVLVNAMFVSVQPALECVLQIGM